MTLSAWQKFVKSKAGSGKSLKKISSEYKSTCKKKCPKSRSKGSGLSGGVVKMSGAAAKGALSELLKGLNANISVK